MSEETEDKVVETVSTVSLSATALTTIIGNITSLGVVWATSNPTFVSLTYGLMFACISALLMYYFNRGKLHKNIVRIVTVVVSVFMVGFLFGTYIFPKLQLMVFHQNALIFPISVSGNVLFCSLMLIITIGLTAVSMFKIWGTGSHHKRRR